MNVVIFGATGMIGQGVLRIVWSHAEEESLQDTSCHERQRQSDRDAREREF
jgi:1-deoxy-D-xylulose 5-phosphate reductoisomerase